LEVAYTNRLNHHGQPNA